MMRNIFKRRRPEPAHRADARISIQDLLILRWYGYTPEQWAALPAIVKVDKREGYFQAWSLGARS